MRKTSFKPVKIGLTLWWYTCTYLWHRGTGTRCAKIEHRTHTRTTHFGISMGIPVPVPNPIYALFDLGHRSHASLCTCATCHTATPLHTVTHIYSIYFSLATIDSFPYPSLFVPLGFWDGEILMHPYLYAISSLPFCMLWSTHSFWNRQISGYILIPTLHAHLPLCGSSQSPSQS
jgi:hypothetical protein